MAGGYQTRLWHLERGIELLRAEALLIRNGAADAGQSLGMGAWAAGDDSGGLGGGGIIFPRGTTGTSIYVCNSTVLGAWNIPAANLTLVFTYQNQAPGNTTLNVPLIYAPNGGGLGIPQWRTGAFAIPSMDYNLSGGVYPALPTCVGASNTCIQNYIALNYHAFVLSCDSTHGPVLEHAAYTSLPGSPAFGSSNPLDTRHWGVTGTSTNFTFPATPAFYVAQSSNCEYFWYLSGGAVGGGLGPPSGGANPHATNDAVVSLQVTYP